MSQSRKSAVERVLREIFVPSYGLYVEKIDESSFTFQARSEYTRVDYETLRRVSEHFKTSSISIEGGEVQTGFCDTCAGSEPVVRITVTNATLPRKLKK